MLDFRTLIGPLALLVSFSSTQAANLVSNGDFENGLDGWTNLSGGTAVVDFSLETTLPYAGNNSFKVSLEQAGGNAWDAQSLGPTVELVTGQEYTLQFVAKADQPGRKARFVIQNSDYVSTDFVLTDEWAEYSWAFTALESAPQVKMHHFDPGVFWFDDIALQGEATVNAPVSLAIDPTIRHQTMIGFGGALTWYSERALTSPHRDAITELVFNDLGGDIVRFKNWYYPANYPENKDPGQATNVRMNIEATQQLFELARAADPTVKILLSSWGPPAGLKSNSSQREGTLKKENGAFVYDAYAQYWVDSLDHIGFEPDWISIQNEPGYVTSGWDTCEWRPFETDQFPSYTIAFDRVYDRIKDRPNAPLMIGPESENVGSVPWGGNTFEEFAAPLVEKEYLAAYAYHLYNFSSGLSMDDDRRLQTIRDNYANKPNIMTEFSKNTMDWLDTALAIHNTVTEADAAGYIYWELVWDLESPSAAIGIDANGNYAVGPHYYTLKHFSKFVRQGDQRLELSGQSRTCRATAYLGADGSRLTVVILNRGDDEQVYSLDPGDLSIAATDGYQTTESTFFVQLDPPDLSGELLLPPRSLTTLVLTLDPPANTSLSSEVVDCDYHDGRMRIEIPTSSSSARLERSRSLTGDSWTPVENAVIQPGLVTTTIIDPDPGILPAFYRIESVE